MTVEVNEILGTTDGITMTPASLSMEIDKLRVANPDPECGHGWIDEILIAVLDRISVGKCTDPAECARLAVEADIELVSVRWYA